VAVRAVRRGNREPWQKTRRWGRGGQEIDGALTRKHSTHDWRHRRTKESRSAQHSVWPPAKPYQTLSTTHMGAVASNTASYRRGADDRRLGASATSSAISQSETFHPSFGTALPNNRTQQRAEMVPSFVAATFAAASVCVGTANALRGPILGLFENETVEKWKMLERGAGGLAHIMSSEAAHRP
jgi:hypothetical protein